VVRLCRTLSCELAGAGETAEQLRRELARGQGNPGAPDIRLEFVHCIGLCDHPPAMSVDDAAVGGATPEQAKAVLARLRR
jgi:NADH:ubiquinone oxidoreductase subunit E